MASYNAIKKRGGVQGRQDKSYGLCCLMGDANGLFTVRERMTAML